MHICYNTSKGALWKKLQIGLKATSTFNYNCCFNLTNHSVLMIDKDNPYPQHRYSSVLVNFIRVVVCIVACVLCFFIVIPVALIILGVRWIALKVKSLLWKKA